MSQINSITFSAYLLKDPTLEHTENGNTVLNLFVSQYAGAQDAELNRAVPITWGVKRFAKAGKDGVNPNLVLMETLKKGSVVIVSGKITSYVKNTEYDKRRQNPGYRLQAAPSIQATDIAEGHHPRKVENIPVGTQNQTQAQTMFHPAPPPLPEYGPAQYPQYQPVQGYNPPSQQPSQQQSYGKSPLQPLPGISANQLFDDADIPF